MAYQTAARAAKDLGYTNVKHLSAGITGLETSRGENRVRRREEGFQELTCLTLS